MSLLTYYRQVFYAEGFLTANHAGVSIGLGMTVGGKLGGFVYNNDNGAICQVVWPRQLAADVAHQVGLTVDGSTLTLYVDGDHYARNAANTGWQNVAHALDFTVSAGEHAALGGVWFGYNNPFNCANAHRVHLGRFSTWDRCLTRAQMWLVRAAGGEWKTYEVGRISKVLDFAGWPSAWRAGLTTPHSTYQVLATPNWDEGASALELVQRAAGSVAGLVFVAADGTLTYQLPTDRDVTGAPDIVFTESDGTAIDADFAYTVDDNDIVNTVTATTRDGLVLSYADPDSVTLYGERAKSIDSDLFYAPDVAVAAQRVVDRYKAPILRCPTVTVDVAATPDAMRAVFDLELGQIIGLAELPNTAPAGSMTVVVESIAWSIDAASGDWKVTFEVSPGTSTATVPGPPTEVSATGGDAEATITFTAPGADGGAAIDNYRVTGSPDDGTVEGASSPLTLTGLANGYEYTFTVAAHNSVGWGAESDASNPVTPAPTGPVEPDVSVVDTYHEKASVSWYAVAGADNYRAYAYRVSDDTWLGYVEGASSPIMVEGVGLVDDTELYSFTVAAHYPDGGWSAHDLTGGSGTYFCHAKPEAPTDLVATAGEAIGTATVSWTAAVDNGHAVGYYQLGYVANDWMSPQTVYDVTVDLTGLEGLTNPMRFWVQAHNSVGWGPMATSNEITVVTA